MRTSSLVVTLAGLLFLVAMPACEDQHIGRMCFIQRATGEGTNVVVNPQALECPARLCLHYPPDPSSGQAVAGGKGLDLCTAECSSDGDCGGEKGDQPGECKGHFKCAWPVQVGALCCKKMCVCADLLNVADSGVEMPEVCDPGNASNGCCNLSGRANNANYPACQ